MSILSNRLWAMLAAAALSLYAKCNWILCAIIRAFEDRRQLQCHLLAKWAPSHQQNITPSVAFAQSKLQCIWYGYRNNNILAASSSSNLICFQNSWPPRIWILQIAITHKKDHLFVSLYLDFCRFHANGSWGKSGEFELCLKVARSNAIQVA